MDSDLSVQPRDDSSILPKKANKENVSVDFRKGQLICKLINLRFLVSLLTEKQDKHNLLGIYLLSSSGN